MSIRSNVEDAVFLFNNGRPLGALSLILIAVAASSRKRLPKGTQSIESPVDEKGNKRIMGDGECFRQFLGGRIKNLLFSAGNENDISFKSGWVVEFKDKEWDLTEVLYKQFRCELIHNSDLPEDFRFIDDNERGMSVGTTADYFTLNYGWLDLLIRAVVDADCNASEFGRSKATLIPVREDFDEQDLKEALFKKFKISEPKFHHLKTFLLAMDPGRVAASPNDVLQQIFISDIINKLPVKGINGGFITALAFLELCSFEGLLTTNGIEVFKILSSNYKVYIPET